MDEDIKLLVWKKARSVDGLDDSMFRKDACGALIMWDKFGKNNPFGWVIDHILPISLGGDDNLLNLRALHYKNNLSKASDYPSYTAYVKYDGRENVMDERNLTVNKKLREKLKQLYKNA
ncbi:HNH endonuclease signature motif containing protein [Bacteroides sp.]|jgi:hypothetical protein|uniref:HNH endonuclease signature motif containing protein n=1 Tax=Bacteroides sp. TaxID=29523 RepID=UPI0025C3212B|nr:HNH endonuclease signature motif containing protein [Bacteroides sp.]